MEDYRYCFPHVDNLWYYLPIRLHIRERVNTDELFGMEYDYPIKKIESICWYKDDMGYYAEIYFE